MYGKDVKKGNAGEEIMGNAVLNGSQRNLSLCRCPRESTLCGAYEQDIDLDKPSTGAAHRHTGSNASLTLMQVMLKLSPLTCILLLPNGQRRCRVGGVDQPAGLAIEPAWLIS